MFVCHICLSAEQGRIEKCIWTGPWASDPARIEGISCSVCHLHSQPLLSSAVIYLHTCPSAYPNPFLAFLSLFPSHTVTILSIHYSLPSSSVCLLPDSSTLLVFFYSLLPWFHLSVSSFQSPLLLLFIPSSFLFFSPSIHSPGEKYGSDEHGEPGTNQSIDPSMYPSLCPSDRQQKTKCLLSKTFPISFYPHSSPLHYPPHLVMERLFLWPVHAAETSRVF